MKRYKPSSGDASNFYRETTAVQKLAKFDASAKLGNLADVLKSGSIIFPNILNPDDYRTIPLGIMKTIESQDVDER